jgi:hypothetical protein
VKLQAPPQLSFDFMRSPDVAPSAAATSTAVSGAGARVLDLTTTLRRKQEDYTRMLYRQILDTVKHLSS